MECSVIIHGLPCRARPLRDTPYCYNHHRYGGPKALSATLFDLWRFAEEFDERSREVGELYPAAEFVAWLKPDLDGLEG